MLIKEKKHAVNTIEHYLALIQNLLMFYFIFITNIKSLSTQNIYVLTYPLITCLCFLFCKVILF